MLQAVMDRKKLVFNYPILEKIVDPPDVLRMIQTSERLFCYDIDEYDKHLPTPSGIGGYTKDI